MQLESETMTPLVHRARRAHGHLARVISMMEDGADCEDVLTQLSAVIKALDRTGYAVVASGLQQCLRAGDGPDSVDAKKLEKLFLTLS